MGDAGRIRGYRNATRTTQAQYGHARHQDTPNLPKTEQVSYACITAISGTFNPLFKVLCTFPSRYLFAIGRQGVLRLGGWSPHVQTEFHVFRPTREQPNALIRTGLSPSMIRLSRRFRFSFDCYWPGPRSLATTNGVSVDFLSSGY